MEIQLIGNNAKTISIADQIFGCEFNEGLVHQVVTAYMAGSRQGSKAQKNRSDVSGGGIKPWRQKGTGRARAGTIRSPIWTGGGVTFAARPRDYSKKVNKKMYRRAMKIILSELLRQERIKVVDELNVAQPKTSELVKQLKEFNLNKVLIITATEDKNIELAARNIANVEILQASQINPLSLVAFENVLVTSEALKQIEEKLS